MTENRRKRRKVIAEDGDQHVARHQKKPVNRDVSVSTMNETEIMEALIDEHEAIDEIGALWARSSCALARSSASPSGRGNQALLGMGKHACYVRLGSDCEVTCQRHVRSAPNFRHCGSASHFRRGPQ